ncbi:hypothetical protein [Nostoc sp. C110]|uniref:hypothetical protein n=1 Tax=Nostoc sp. C110 TaxID=3349876 RepID=UPI00370D1217
MLIAESEPHGLLAGANHQNQPTINEHCAVILKFEDLILPKKFAQLVTDAPQWTEWMA